MFFNIEKRILKLATERQDGFHFEKIYDLAGKKTASKIKAMKAIAMSGHHLGPHAIVDLAGWDLELGKSALEILSSQAGSTTLRKDAARCRANLLVKHPQLIDKALIDLEEKNDDLFVYSIGCIGSYLQDKKNEEISYEDIRHRIIQALAKIGTKEALQYIGAIGGNVAIDALLANGSDDAIDLLTLLAIRSPANTAEFNAGLAVPIPAERPKIVDGLLKIRTFKAAMAIGLITNTDDKHDDMVLVNFINLKREFNTAAGGDGKWPAIEGEIRTLLEAKMNPDALVPRLYDFDRKQTRALGQLLREAAESVPDLDVEKVGVIFKNATASVSLLRRSKSLVRQAVNKSRSSDPIYTEVFQKTWFESVIREGRQIQ